MNSRTTDHQAPSPSPPLPWKLRILFGAISFLLDLISSSTTVNRGLLSLFNRKAPPSLSPQQGVSSSDITIDPSRELWFRIYNPTLTGDDVSLPVLIFFHGGGFVFGSADSLITNSLCRRFARDLGAVVISVNYRLAPEYRFPSAYEDGFDALKFIDSIDDSMVPANADLSRCFFSGESAGGNLAHHVAVKAGEYEFKKVKVIGLVLVQPFFGGLDRTESESRHSRGPLLTLGLADWFWKAFLPIGSDRDHPAANVFGPEGVDISGVNFPATIVFVGGFDPLQDRNRRYHEWLKGSGKESEMVEYPNAIHGFIGFEALPESGLVMQELRDFMQKQMVR